MIPMNLINKKTRSSEIQKNKNETEVRLRNFAFMTKEDLFSQLSVTQKGLSQEDAENRQDEFGKNVITAGNKNTTLHRLLEAAINPFNIILLLIATITYFTDVVLSSRPDYLTVTIILSLVLLSSLVAFVQSQRSNSAAEKLSKMISNKAEA
jgi:Mg2+-importing ATPase